jgi:Fic family protein
MSKLEKQINTKEKDIIKHVSLIHSDFEKIHPFSD